MTGFKFAEFLTTPDAPAATPEQTATEMVQVDGLALSFAKLLRIADERGLNDFERLVKIELEKWL
jgi:hypothetical protein